MFLQVDADGAAADAASALGLSSCSRNIEFVRAQDWESAIRDSYQPVQIAPSLWIVPTWAEAVDPGAVNLILEPGLAFGTGDHPTTRLCLRWLQGLDVDGLRIMDYGTGSGVLAVAALLMGAKHAVRNENVYIKNYLFLIWDGLVAFFGVCLRYFMRLLGSAL